ncbi:low molecular weight phosphatase family protein [Aureimonas leprariae]|uniref:Low molecular weight phosphatase family protein n=1 Tax=Plantimonas leprariae TaxID=2615207 RepID=A0A7V7PQD2_9HYPH|nr:low molecular weight phosphatase family protein [Aureimonas leprariae]KAB0680378.1 low molecular weight phosphatase family protein [Aureimonas leprariae]
MSRGSADRQTSPGAARPVSSVLFVCGMNAIRSPMAEAVTRALLPKVYTVSAGVRKGDADPIVGAVLAERGLTLGLRQPQSMEELADSYFDLIVTLAPEAHHVALDLTGAQAVEVEYWPMPDPSAVEGSRAQILDAYRDVLSRIEAKIMERLAPAGAPAR